MAKIWKVQGNNQRGKAAAELPWLKCCELLELDEFCRTEDRPKFEATSPGGIFTTHVVVQLEADEAKANSMKPGFFVSPLDPHTAETRLDGRHDRQS